MFPMHFTNTCHDGSSSGAPCNKRPYITTLLQIHTCNDYEKTNSNEGVKQNKSPNSSRIQFLEADLDQEPSSLIFRD